MSDFENDPEVFDEPSEDFLDGAYDRQEAMMDYVDPFEDWFMPGYQTEMDYMNAQEADDYRNELSDLDGDDIDF